MRINKINNVKDKHSINFKANLVYSCTEPGITKVRFVRFLKNYAKKNIGDFAGKVYLNHDIFIKHDSTYHEFKLIFSESNIALLVNKYSIAFPNISPVNRRAVDEFEYDALRDFCLQIKNFNEARPQKAKYISPDISILFKNHGMRQRKPIYEPDYSTTY